MERVYPVLLSTAGISGYGSELSAYTVLLGGFAMSPPTGTITFLFTDVEGSTRLWEQSPDAMRHALTRHDALASDLMGRHDGLLIKSRGEGDSLFGVFEAAPNAARAACAFGQALAAEDWPVGTSLRVRIALHTGEANLRESDYYGPAVNRCARLRSLALGGQILLSALTRSLVVDALPEGASLIGLGLKKLRDLSEPEFVYQLTHPALAASLLSDSLPALPAEEVAPVHFLASLIRRETDLAEVKAVLTGAHHALHLPAGPANFLSALVEANRVGLEEVKKAWERERTADADLAEPGCDALFKAVLDEYPAPETVSRLDLLLALAHEGGLTLWEAKRLVDDFCRRQAPRLKGYDKGWLKSLADRMRR